MGWRRQALGAERLAGNERSVLGHRSSRLRLLALMTSPSPSLDREACRCATCVVLPGTFIGLHDAEVVAEDRDHPRSSATDADDNTPRTFHHVMSGDVTEVGPHEPCSCAEADEPDRAHAPGQGRLCTGEREMGGDLLIGVRGLRALAWKRHRRRRPWGSTRRATKRRLERSVRLVAEENPSVPHAMKRSITEGWKTTSSLASRPMLIAKVVSLAVANNRTFARPGLSGAAFFTAARAKRAASCGPSSAPNEAVTALVVDINPLY